MFSIFKSQGKSKQYLLVLFIPIQKILSTVATIYGIFKYLGRIPLYDNKYSLKSTEFNIRGTQKIPSLFI